MAIQFPRGETHGTGANMETHVRHAKVRERYNATTSTKELTITQWTDGSFEFLDETVDGKTLRWRSGSTFAHGLFWAINDLSRRSVENPFKSDGVPDPSQTAAGGGDIAESIYLKRVLQWPSSNTPGKDQPTDGSLRLDRLHGGEIYCKNPRDGKEFYSSSEWAKRYFEAAKLVPRPT